MAITRTLTFTGITINGVDYSKHLQENAEITIEPIMDMVDEGQTIPSAYDISFSIDIYDVNLLSDSNIHTSGYGDSSKTNIVFNGVDGGADFTIEDVIINGKKKYDQNRVAVNLHGSKRAISVEDSITPYRLISRPIVGDFETYFDYTPPFNIFESNNQYVLKNEFNSEFNLRDYANISVTKTYYVDSVNGDDNNDGSESTPFKTLTKVENEGDADRIVLAANSYFYDNQVVQLTGDIEVIGLGDETTRPQLTNDQTNQIGSFSVHSGDAYVATITTQNLSYVIDRSNPDTSKLLTKRNSIQEVIDNANSWYYIRVGGIDYVYVHTFDGRAPDSDLEFFGTGYVYSLTANNTTQYWENIKFSGQIRNSGSNIVAGKANLKIYLQNCDFRGIVHGVDEFIIKDSVLTGGGDILNYDRYPTTGVDFVVTRGCEINISATNNFTGGSSDQSSTQHQGTRLLRINSRYFDTAGQNVADVTDSVAWMIGCIMENSNEETSFYIDSDGRAWLENCQSIGNNIDIDARSTSKVYLKNFTSDGANAISGSAEILNY